MTRHRCLRRRDHSRGSSERRLVAYKGPAQNTYKHGRRLSEEEEEQKSGAEGKNATRVQVECFSFNPIRTARRASGKCVSSAVNSARQGVQRCAADCDPLAAASVRRRLWIAACAVGRR
uniref:Uncharacterized protein n=1 Tax=Plectus sambesii TaxID=2011161 RepID=A0A914WTL5_9BILA